MALKNTVSDYTRNFRNSPGATKRIHSTAVVSANSFATLASVDGKGQISGGVIKPFSGVDQHLSEIWLEIDSVVIAAPIIWHLNYWGQSPPANYPLRLIKYDTILHAYAVDIMAPLSFDVSFRLYYFERAGADLNVSTRLFYTLYE